MTNSKSLLYGVLLGSIIGGVSVLLSTPTSGKELRNIIRKNQKQLTASFSQIATDGQFLKEQVANSTKKSISVITDFSMDVKKSINQWKEDIQENQKSIQKELSEIENAIQNLENTVQKK
ncbi:YtxH domain-containing protein [Fredinandcohnia quinoae]|uniref:YtxH domain-containing protein n=1 Tax=Fredinandcohnia quinoae TaxID=2918902 RepID=A0AAW5EDF5_9BACI|nr:YtxH domain-containing protein [Fredinandcohnia sp. SECRCQ15]MCH1626799.1 YtxH domain-containing protein [Fredinandcohnia sp. SECRCQ15]